MQFSFDNILVINQFVVQTKLELLAAGCLCIHTYICVCVKRMMNYICGEIYQVERVNIIETAMGRHIYDVYALWHSGL